MEVNEIALIAQDLGIDFTHMRPPNSLNCSEEAAGKHDFIFVGGSTFIAAEILS